MMDLSKRLSWPVVIAIALLASELANAQERSRNRSRQATHPSRSSRQQPSMVSSTTLAKAYLESCYRLGTPLPIGVSARFMASDFQWEQPSGIGSPISLTYSYSNLLGGTVDGVTDDELRATVEEALGVWARYVPIHFIEVKDSGPIPSAAEQSYSASGTPKIRIGTHVIDGRTGGELAHAYLPFSTTNGIAGDLHLDVDEDWTQNNGGYLLEVVLHELGHVLGLEHVENIDAIMNPFVMERFNGLGEAYLLPDDIEGIQSIYGEGIGSVTPLVVVDDPDPPENPDGPSGDDGSTANNVLVTYDEETGQLSISGDAANNEVVVFSGCWYVAVAGLNETTINDQSWVYFVSSADKFIEGDLGSGNDSLICWGVHAGDVTASLGDGDDQAAVIFCRIGSLGIDGGDGDDQYSIFFNRIEAISIVGFE